MNQTARILLCLAAGAICLGSTAADDSAQDDSSARTIHLKQDDAQVRFVLKNKEDKEYYSEALFRVLAGHDTNGDVIVVGFNFL